MAEVVLEHVTKRFAGGDVAVNDLSLRVGDGEFIVLVGPSGCGKTTTLRLIAGLEKLTSGNIYIGGRIVNHDHPRDRNVAMVFQDYALYPHMTVQQNMAFGLKMRRVRRREIRKKVHEAAAALGIVDLLRRKPGALSGGQRQRAALGRAIVRDPHCSLLDEPLSNLDAAMRAALRVELKSLHQRLRKTMVFVTHDQEEAMTLGDRVAVMNRGSLQQVGTPLEVYRQPANRFVAGFVGAPAMNFINGRIQRNAARWSFVGDGGLSLPVSDAASIVLQNSEGREAVLGVRPEHVRFGSESIAAFGSSAPLNVRVEMTEIVGDQMNVHGQAAGGTKITARIRASDQLHLNQTATFHVDPNDLHFFELGENGRNLVHR